MLSILTFLSQISQSCELLFFLCLCTGMRYHLFVWTVFSPKLLYAGTLTIVLASVATLGAVTQSTFG